MNRNINVFVLFFTVYQINLHFSSTPQEIWPRGIQDLVLGWKYLRNNQGVFQSSKMFKTIQLYKLSPFTLPKSGGCRLRNVRSICCEVEDILQTFIPLYEKTTHILAQ